LFAGLGIDVLHFLLMSNRHRFPGIQQRSNPSTLSAGPRQPGSSAPRMEDWKRRKKTLLFGRRLLRQFHAHRASCGRAPSVERRTSSVESSALPAGALKSHP